MILIVDDDSSRKWAVGACPALIYIGTDTKGQYIVHRVDDSEWYSNAVIDDRNRQILKALLNYAIREDS